MVRLFWTQNENPNTPNTIITTSGEIITLKSSESKGYALFEDLLNYQEHSKPFYRSGNLVVKKHKNGYFISSNFVEKDDSGRKMGFMLFTENTNYKTLIDDLFFFSRLIDRTFEEVDINNIIKKKTNKNRQIVIVILVTATILTLYMLWK